MISNELKDIIDNLKKQGKMYFLEGATEDEISQFEKEHNIIFPKKFREWLKFSDGGDLFLPVGVQFHGVAHKPLINVEDNDRPNDKYTVIGVLASGDPILFEKTEEKIIVFDNEVGTIEDELVYEDFFSLLNDLYDLLGIEE